MGKTKTTAYNRVGHLLPGTDLATQYDTGDLNVRDKENRRRSTESLNVYVRVGDTPFGRRVEYVDADTGHSLYVYYIPSEN